MIELAPGTYWWVREGEQVLHALHLVTGVFAEDSTVTTIAASARKAGNVMGCWPIQEFLNVARPASTEVVE